MPKLYTLNFKTIKSTLFWLDNNYIMNLVIYHSKDRPIIQSYGNNWFITPRYYIEITSLYKNSNGLKNAFVLNTKNMFQFKLALKNIAILITGKESVFYRDSNNNIQLDKSRTKPIRVDGVGNTTIHMMLGIHTGQQDNSQEPSVFFMVNNAEDFIMMNLETFMNFKTFVENLDVYNAVMNTLLYVGRFEERDLDGEETEYINNKKNGGGGSSGGRKGFLDKIGAVNRSDSKGGNDDK